MVEMLERAELLASLRGYLDELRESGVDELPFADGPAPAVAAPPPVKADVAAVPAVPAPVSAGLPPSVDGIGNPQARLLFVIVGGGFEGPSGNLLAKIVVAMGFTPEEVFLIPLPRETFPTDAALRKALLARIGAVAPTVVVALGERAAQLLFDSSEQIARLRGHFVEVDGTSVMATLHPDQLLADETLKREVWNEMKQVISRLG